MSLSACVGILEIIYYSLLPHFRLEPRLAVTPPICYLPLDLAVCAALNHHHHHHHHPIILICHQICHSKCRYKSSDPSCHFVAEVLLVSSPAVHCLVIGLGLYHSTPFAEKTQKELKVDLKCLQTDLGETEWKFSIRGNSSAIIGHSGLSPRTIVPIARVAQYLLK